VFGFSFSELLMICVVALIAVGPKKLPGMLHSLGQFIRKMRNMTNDVRNQTGIDQLLRAEGLHGGLNELRGLLRINHGISFDPPHVSTPALNEPVVNTEPVASTPLAHTPFDDPYAHIAIDNTREYPPEGADAYGALPDDLLGEDSPAAVTEADEAPAPAANANEAPAPAANADEPAAPATNANEQPAPAAKTSAQPALAANANEEPAPAAKASEPAAHAGKGNEESAPAATADVTAEVTTPSA